MRRNFGLGTLGNFLLGFALYALGLSAAAISRRHARLRCGAERRGDGLDRAAAAACDPARAAADEADRRRACWSASALIVFAASCFMNLHLDPNYAAPQLFWPDVTRALGQALVMTPLSAIAMVGITPDEAGAASGLFNMLRNLGGAIGTAAIETFFTKREQFHSFIINAHVSLLRAGDPQTRLAELQQYFMSHGFPDPAGAMHRAVDRRRRHDPRAGDDHGLRRLLRLARGRAARSHPSGRDAEKGHRLQRHRTLGLERCTRWQRRSLTMERCDHRDNTDIVEHCRHSPWPRSRGTHRGSGRGAADRRTSCHDAAGLPHTEDCGSRNNMTWWIMS